MPGGHEHDKGPPTSKNPVKIRSGLVQLYKDAKHKINLIRKRFRLLDLPDDLILCIADHLETEADINRLSRVNHRLHNLLDPYLYLHNVQHSNSEALLWAAEKGNPATARKALQQGANVETKSDRSMGSYRDYTRVTPLWLATYWGYAEVVKLLLEVPHINPEPYGPWYYKTPLHVASSLGHVEIVTLLLKKPGVHPNRPTGRGKAPLYYAAMKGRVEVVERLLQIPDIIVNISAAGETPLIGAIRRGHDQIVKALVEHKSINLGPQSDGEGQSKCVPLETAAALNRSNMVKWLLEKNAKVDFRLSANSHTALMQAVYRNNVEMVKMLLHYGADVNITHPSEGSALIQACTEADQDVVELLLDAGANVNATGGYHGGPLQTASRRSEPIAKMLIGRGADINAKDDSHRSGGQWSTSRGSCPLHNASDGGYEELVKMLLHSGAEVNATNLDGATALHAAAYRGHRSIVQLLLEHGANVHLRNNNGSTALDRAEARKQ